MKRPAALLLVLALCAGAALLSCSSAPKPSDTVMTVKTEGDQSSASGQSYYLQGRYELALQFFSQALTQYTSVDDGGGIVRAYIGVGRCEVALGQPDEAETAFQRARQRAQQEANAALLFDSRMNLAELYLSRGDPSQARCEAHGGWLGSHGGDFQHVMARGMGGCKDPLINSAANCALLCRRCHDLAEARDPHMEAAGFWARQGTDPRMVPMMLASEHGSGILVWRSMDGRYLFEAPELAA